MKLDPNKVDWKKAGFIGIVLGIASVPIMLWRSYKVGKITYTIMFGFLLIKLITFGADKLSNAYFNIDNVFKVRSQINPVLNDIYKINKELVKANSEIDSFKENLEKINSESVTTFNSELRKEVDNRIEKLKELDLAIAILKEQERNEVKNQIIELREAVKIHGYSIEEAVIRKKVESVASFRYLLTDDEKDIFNDQLPF